jgi:uncharacterized protein YbjT (DUF2867 family)
MQTGKDKILVTGATGQQGGAVARELLAAGHAVRAMTRKPDGDAAQALAALGAEVVAGDLDDTASLEAALDGVWGVFAVQNSWEAGIEGEEAQGKRIAQLAKDAGVQHFVYTSVGGADRKTGIPHFDNKFRIEEKVRSLGFPSHTVLRPVFFMENFLSPWYKPAIDDGNLAISMPPDTKLQMIALADIGKYGRMAFEQHDTMNGKAIELAGDDVTMPQAAEIIGKASDKPISFSQVPIEEVRKFSDDFATMFEWFGRVGYDTDIQGNAKEYGIEPTSLEEWAASASWN